MNDITRSPIRASELIDGPLWQAVPDGLLLVDLDGAIVAANSVIEEMFGFESDALTGAAVETLVPLDLRDRHVRHRADRGQHALPRPMAASRLLHGVRADGSKVPVLVSLSSLNLAGELFTLAVVRDLSERVATEQRAGEARRREAIADERDRIANDLHDEVIQQVFAIGLGLQAIPDRIDDHDAATRITAAVDGLDDVITTIRRTIRALRSPELPRLRHRVLDVVNSVESVLDAPVELVFVGKVDEIKTTQVAEQLLPTLREALTNVARHAAATAVWVSVGVTAGRLILRITDDGVGIGASQRRSGLASMESRAYAVGGTLTVSGREPAGTVVEWSVPLV